MKRKTKVKISGRVDNTDGATITIDPNANVISIRPKGRHRDYTLPLETIAKMVVYQVVTADLASDRKPRKVRRGVL